MSFSDIPIRVNGKGFLIVAAWFNTIRTELINAFGGGGYIKEMAPQTITAAGEVTLDALAFKPMAPVSGAGGAQTASATPFGVAHGYTGGKEIIIIGDTLSETNPVTFEANDVDEGIYMQGKVIISRGQTLTLVYFENEKRFYRKEIQ